MALTMTLKLNAPGMTSLHKAGLAGLFMTLRALQEKNRSIDGLEWSLEPKQVGLYWKGETPTTAFERLIERSFWIDNQGFIRLTGLEIDNEPNYDQRYFLYYALLHSFLQFGPHRPTESKRTLTYEVDDHLCVIKDFAPIKRFRHQSAAKDFVDHSFNDSVDAAGWLYPGGGQRHVVHASTKLNEPLELALPLLFAPVGVVYYLIKSRAKLRKTRLAMLIPEIENLEDYAEIRRVLAAQGTIEMSASSASDAALRMLIIIEANRATKQLGALSNDPLLCRVIAFGIVPWNEKQKTRTYARSLVSDNLPGFENYRIAAGIFKNRWQRVPPKIDRGGNAVEPERFFVTTFSARELIADNIGGGKFWYHGIADYMAQKEIREQLFYEGREMHEMVEKASFDDERKRRFINVCHESWRSRMGKLGDRARAENLGDDGFKRLVNKERERLRISLARSKNARTLRETVVDFWARAGSSKELQGDGLMKVLPLFDETNWREARDLALLALVSYRPKEDFEKEASISETLEGGEEL